MPGLVQARSKSRSLLVILPCGALAFALPLLFREGALKPAAPAIFLLVIILVAHFSGPLGESAGRHSRRLGLRGLPVQTLWEVRCVQCG